MIRDDDALEYHSSQPAGKIAITATKPCLTQRDLSLAYTPGVAAPCIAPKLRILTALQLEQCAGKGNYPRHYSM